MKFQSLWRTLVIILVATNSWAATSIALMDFSVTDNSYRSVQNAAEFTGILQAQLGDAPDVMWVEREQLEQARRELELSAMGLAGGTSYIRLGKWVKADWMVTGQFSLDDRSRRTLFIEITDLQHADMLASRILIFPGNGVSPVQPVQEQVRFAAKALRELLTEAHLHQQQTTNRILVAPLFLADVTRVAPGFGSSKEVGTLEPDFNKALASAAATNGQVQLISFPKAYRSLDESELVLNGLVEADRNAWQQTADLFVWGTYAMRLVGTGKPDYQLEMDLDVWDGVSPPTVIREKIPSSFTGKVSPIQLNSALNRLANEVLAHARKRMIQTDTDAVRRKIAGSLLQTYDQMTLDTPHSRQTLGFDNPEKFMQAIHILETACFFDPDNANARVLYVTCRWGFWMNFNSMVKNEFWSKWRRSQAWGQYVEQFGLKPVSVDLSFPYEQEGGIPEAYLQSLDDVLKMFPQWHSTNEMALEDQWQRQGVYTSLMEAEYHGFPKAMPHDLAWEWKKEVKAEYRQRLTKVVEFVSESQTSQGEMSPIFLFNVVHGILNLDAPSEMRLAPLEKIWPVCVQVSRQSRERWIISQSDESAFTNLCREAGQPEKAGQLLAMLSPNQPAAITAPRINSTTISATQQTSSSWVPIPKWLTEIRPAFSMFRLFPPNALPLEIHPSMRPFQFPEHFDVQAVKQMDFLSDKLLILALDEHSAPSSASRPDVSAEQLEKRGRLWVLPRGADNPVLYEPELFSETIRSFLLDRQSLWVVGKDTGCLDLKTHKMRKFDLRDGFSLQEPDTLDLAGSRIFAAGESFKVCTWDSQSGRWNELPRPSGDLFATGLQPLLIGNQRWLISSFGSVLAYDIKMGTWTNLSEVESLQGAAAESSGFWFGTHHGLQLYDPDKKSFKRWPAPCVVQSPMSFLVGHPYSGRPAIPIGDLEKLDDRIQDSVKNLVINRATIHELKRKQQSTVDPLQLNWRVPGEVTAMANDGDFLWFGVGNYFGNYLLLLHKPSDRLVACCPLEARGRIASLAVSPTSVWVGMAYRNQLLFHIPKAAFLSIPKNQWTSLAISQKEREHLIKSMSVRDQAMYAFYAGDDAEVARLFADVNPDNASLEEMFLLAFSYDTSGLDRPDLCRSWFERIVTRYPDSPWEKAAQNALAKNELDSKAKAH